MLLYTVLPIDDVLEGIDATPQATMMLRLGNLDVEVEKLEELKVKVVRILSTNPEDYLLPHCQPGSIINLDQV